MTPTARLRSPGASTSRSARSTTPRASPRAASSPRSSSTRSTPARSPRSSDSARLCAAGARRSWPTSQPAASATAGQKRSTASSRRPGGWPTASATSPTTASGSCSPPTAHAPTDADHRSRPNHADLGRANKGSICRYDMLAFLLEASPLLARERGPQPSAWKVLSTNFAFSEFYEVRCPI